MAAFDGTNGYAVGDKVELIEESELIDGEIVAVAIEPTTREANGYYAVRCDDGIVRTFHHISLAPLTTEFRERACKRCGEDIGGYDFGIETCNNCLIVYADEIERAQWIATHDADRRPIEGAPHPAAESITWSTAKYAIHVDPTKHDRPWYCPQCGSSIIATPDGHLDCERGHRFAWALHRDNAARNTALLFVNAKG